MNRTIDDIIDADEGNSCCPVTTTMQVIGNKWKPVVIHRLLEDESSGFSELESAIGGISSKALSKTLKDLERFRIVDRRVVSDRPFRVEYSLTRHGEALESVVREMEQWGTEHLPEIRREAPGGP